MDRLEHLLAIQRQLNDTIKEKRGLQNIQPMEWMQKYTLAM